jgi:tRNA A-37 threonylcarbamoyl transferase component Bud32
MEKRRFGNYVLKERITSGGMADVFRASREGVMGISREVCIKMIRSGLADGEITAMFIDEARISTELRHANIVGVEDFGEVDGALYIVMEWVHGADVSELLRRAAPAGKGLPLGIALHILGGLLRALGYAHAKCDASGRWLQIVHRDVSPQNLLVSFEGDVKLTDFGIAKATSRMHATVGAVLKGKYAYLSPEQALYGEVDGRSDLFAVGVVAHEIVTGCRPFGGPTSPDLVDAIINDRRIPLAELRPDLPEGVRAVINRLLASQPRDRYQSADEARADLERLPEWADGARALRALMRSTFGTAAFSTLDDANRILGAIATEMTPATSDASADTVPGHTRIERPTAGRYAAVTLAARPAAEPVVVETTVVARAPAALGALAASPSEPTPLGVEVVTAARASASLRPRAAVAITPHAAAILGGALVVVAGMGVFEMERSAARSAAAAAVARSTDPVIPGRPGVRGPVILSPAAQADIARRMAEQAEERRRRELVPGRIFITAPVGVQVMVDGRLYPESERDFSVMAGPHDVAAVDSRNTLLARHRIVVDAGRTAFVEFDGSQPMLRDGGARGP